MAIADNVLVGIRSEADLQELEILPGENELPLYVTGVGKKSYMLEKALQEHAVGQDPFGEAWQAHGKPKKGNSQILG